MPLRDRSKRRYSGVLLAVSSLPSKHGIGSFGENAYRFVDFLKSASQRFWQILPLNILGEGNSPYKSISCFAGELLYIDIDLLVCDGLLKNEDIPEYTATQNVDYKAVRDFKMPLLKKAAENFDIQNTKYQRFIRENSWWLDDFSIFASAISVYKTKKLSALPDGIKYRLPEHIKRFKEKHIKQITFYKITQYLFYKQYFALKEYANKNGIMIIGDIPFYISSDSADVWVRPDDFKIGRDFTPISVAGVPPDIFSKTGQLWGNPIYNWQNMRRNDFEWWCQRLSFCRDIYDVLRIDHFRAFANYYSIPYGSTNAIGGSWEKGNGEHFWDRIREKIGDINIIAEDLGGEDDPDVISLLKHTDFPNMKILQFGFDGDLSNRFLPQNYEYNCVCYTGTHDNDTTRGWYDNATRKEKAVFNSLTKNNELHVSHRLIRSASKSASMLCIIPMQDLLNLDASARMNTPGTKRNNWRWQMSENNLTTDNAKLLKELTKERN